MSSAGVEVTAGEYEWISDDGPEEIFIRDRYYLTARRERPDQNNGPAPPGEADIESQKEDGHSRGNLMGPRLSKGAYVNVLSL